MKDNGYWQAVDRLAWEIYQLSKQTQIPLMDANPFLLDHLELDDITEFCHAAMPQEEIDQWETLDNIFTVVSETYQVDPDEIDQDVQVKIFQFDLHELAVTLD